MDFRQRNGAPCHRRQKGQERDGGWDTGLDWPVGLSLGDVARVDRGEGSSLWDCTIELVLATLDDRLEVFENLEVAFTWGSAGEKNCCCCDFGRAAGEKGEEGGREKPCWGLVCGGMTLVDWRMRVKFPGSGPEDAWIISGRGLKPLPSNALSNLLVPFPCSSFRCTHSDRLGWRHHSCLVIGHTGPRVSAIVACRPHSLQPTRVVARTTAHPDGQEGLHGDGIALVLARPLPTHDAMPQTSTCTIHTFLCHTHRASESFS